ncbi:PA14 domain-containing protein [Leptolyngbya sp. NIES-3755]|nr:PA14 domain-containing protein [Leptolyngbya sp. NIES-3755]
MPVDRRSLFETPLNPRSSSTERLVFIDPSVENAQSLVNSAVAGTKVILLNGNQDGIEQISTVLAGYRNVESVHIVSHGSIGSLTLGNATLDLSTLSRYETELKAWSNSLSTDADILLYGCNVAAGDNPLISQLSEITGADIAGSIDTTGSAAKGGNWTLEAKTGSIEASLPFNVDRLSAYTEILETGNGLLGEYFDNIDFTAPILSRTDTTVNFNWNSGSPDPNIGPDTFSVRWTGQILAPTTGTYQFFTTTDDGVRLFVNGQQVINSFINQPATERTGTISLVAGQRYDIRMEYFENGGSASSQLSWSGPGITKQIIPQSQLFSAAPPPPPPPLGGNGNGLRAEYFDNADFTGTRVTRTDAIVNFNWGSGSPDPLIAPDTFSALWTGQILAPTTGAYQFFTTTDDGARLFINGQQVIDSFINQAATERTGTINLVGGQRYDIRMEYFENGGLASARLAWAGPGITKQIVPQSQLFSNTTPPPPPPPAGTGTGLRGEYFDNIDFTSLRVTRTDPTVNFNWGTGSPDPQIAPDTFSVRWTGQIEPLYSDTYTFFTTTDDGVRLFVNGQLVIDSFIDQGATERRGTIALQAGQKYDIRMEYYERGGGAVAQLGWFSTNQSRQIIPQSQLYSAAVVANPGTIVMGTNAVTVNEDSGTATVRIDRVNGSDGIATVRYTTADGSALAGSDYTTTAGILTFAAGETTKTVTIPIVNDTTPEATEEFGFGLGETTGAALGINRTARITIIDNDAPSTYEFSGATYNVNENSTTATITVQRGGNTAIVGSVIYATSNGTATAGSDYTAATGTLSFAVGETSKTFVIPITDDSDGERNETVNLTLSAPVGGTLGTQRTAILTIADNDPGSFARESVITGLSQPTAFDWTPGGEYLFVAQKNGVVRVARNGVLQQTPAVDISAQVNSPRDRGLLGLAVHPGFFTGNPYVYLLYSYDPPETAQGTGLAARDQVGNRTARLGRFTASIANGVVTINPASEVVILGKNSTWANISRPDRNSTSDFTIRESGLDANGNYIQDFLNLDSESHSIGTVKFGTDGFLYVSNGDGASYNDVDPRAVRTLSIDSLSGKILRIDPITGDGLSTNPFYDGDPQSIYNRDLKSNRSKVWQLGLRNPFRFTVNKDNGQVYVGDVGWTQWEEVNTGRGGENFGWVAYEGGNGTSLRTGGYQNLSSVQAFYTSGRPVTAPWYSYRHFGSGGNAIGVGDFYTGETFPAIYDDNLFITDLSKGTIDALILDANGAVSGQRRFADGLFGLAQITTGPDGNLYYASLGGSPGTGEIGRWRPVTNPGGGTQRRAVGGDTPIQIRTTSVTPDNPTLTPEQQENLLFFRDGE